MFFFGILSSARPSELRIHWLLTMYFRDAERARMEEYERELQEMKDRVQRRPLLFEQESQVVAL